MRPIILSILFSACFFALPAQAVACHLLDSSQPVPEGFGCVIGGPIPCGL